MLVPELLSRYHATIDAGLKEALAQGDTPLYGMLRYHMGWVDESFEPSNGYSGKAVRPTLCLFACEAVGRDWRSALPAAVSLELIHNFSLLHDDMQDGDMERHHRATVWYQWGYGHGLNSGSALNILANHALLEAVPSRLPAGQAFEISRILTRACLEMIEGQALDLSYERLSKVSTADYLLMIEKKTGALLEAAVHMGAVIGGNQERSVEGFREFGHAIGRMFQVRDDILGVWGKSEETGKPAASDLHRRKKSLPVVHALEHEGLSPSAQRFIPLYRNKDSLDESDIHVLLSVLEALGTLRFCQDIAQEEARKALAALDGLNISSWARRQGSELVTFLLERDY